MSSALTLAADGPAWGGAVAGFIALGIFVVFSGWIIAQRVRAKEAAQRTRARDIGRRAPGRRGPTRRSPDRKDIDG